MLTQQLLPGLDFSGIPKPRLVLVYEYEPPAPLTLKQLFYKLQELDPGYVYPQFGGTLVRCTFKPKNQSCIFSRADLEWRIAIRLEARANCPKEVHAH